MPRLIKKYPNRRLYDTRTSVYIKHEDVRDLILEGHTVKVIDTKNDKDVTQIVLLQILMEMEEQGDSEHQFFNDLILHQMIRFHQHDSIFLSKAFRDYVSYLSHLTYSQSVDEFSQYNLDYMSQWQKTMKQFFFQPAVKNKPSSK